MPSQILRSIERRRARRAISPESVPPETVDTLLRAAHLAPSCFNHQPWRFVVVDAPAALTRVNAAMSAGNYWTKTAPVIIAVASRRDLDCALSDRRDYFLFGCGIAVGNLMAQATEIGLIAHPIAGYKPSAVKEALGIPEEYVLITLIIVGRPGDDAGLSEAHRAVEREPRDRRPLQDVVSWNRFAFDDPAPADQMP